jgi:hypothetical protein
MKARSFLDPQFNPADDQAVVELPVGSWLLARRRGYTHHGIYVGGGRVAHYAGLLIDLSGVAPQCAMHGMHQRALGKCTWVQPTASEPGEKRGIVRFSR